MNKKEFLRKLDSLLKGMSEEDKKEILFDYSEHFAVGLSEGRSEEEIAESLGDPKVIAKEIGVNYRIEEAEKNSSAGNIFRAVFATIGLGLFNLLFILAPFIAIFAVIFSFYITGGALIFSGIAIFIGTFLEPLIPQYVNIPVNFFVSIFTSIGVTALGFLWTIGTIYISKFFYKFTVKYLKMNLSIITNRRSRNEVEI